LLYPDADEEREREVMSFAFTQLTDGVLPFELAAAQMPQRISRQGRIFELSYRAISEAAPAGVLVIVRDVTTRVASERAERVAAEQHAMVAALLRDKGGFKAFVDETDRSLASLVPTNARSSIMRAVHTIKGNSATFGLASVAERCHAIEAAMEDEPRLPEKLVAELVAVWRERLRAVGEFVVGTDDIEVRSSDYASLLSDLRRRRDYQELLGFVQSWSWDRTSDRLGRLATQASQIGERLGKPVAIHIEHNDLRMTGEGLDELWAALIHVVRNAVDHGIEPEDVRARAGKAPQGSLTLTTRRDRDGIMTITLADDGCGIDYEHLAAKARARGIEFDDLADLPFIDGLSSREDVSELSGRGVGMSAVRAACERAGGKMRVISERGRGTSFELRFDPAAERPVRALGARAA
jgi:chemotaxis protein histidine kinase CheA